MRPLKVIEIDMEQESMILEGKSFFNDAKIIR